MSSSFSPVQVRQGTSIESPAEDHKDHEGPKASPLGGRAQRPETVKPVEERTGRVSYQCL